MNYGDLTRARARLRSQVLQKEAGVVGKALGLPFKAMGWGTKKAVRGGTAPIRAAARASYGAVKKQHPIAAPVMFGGGVAGIGAAGMSSVGKGREYYRGLDPRVLAMKQQMR